MRARTVGLVCSRELRAKTPAFVTAATPLQRGGLNSLWIKLGILLGKTISSTLARTYVSGSNGYRFMLSVPYGSDPCGVLQALKLEVCFPARGSNRTGTRRRNSRRCSGRFPRSACSRARDPARSRRRTGSRRIPNRVATLRLQAAAPDGAEAYHSYGVGAGRLKHMGGHRTGRRITEVKRIAPSTSRSPIGGASDRRTPIQVTGFDIPLTEVPAIFDVVERIGCQGTRRTRGVKEYRQRRHTRGAARDHRKRG